MIQMDLERREEPADKGTYLRQRKVGEKYFSLLILR